MIGIAQSNPITTAAAVGGAIATGIFLWSRRNQLSGQITNLAEQVNEWRERRGSDQGSNTSTGAGGGEEGSTSSADEGQRSQVEISREALALKEAGTSA